MKVHLGPLPPCGYLGKLEQDTVNAGQVTCLDCLWTSMAMALRNVNIIAVRVKELTDPAKVSALAVEAIQGVTRG